jgi:Mg/Co/Ni transporter MgtE
MTLEQIMDVIQDLPKHEQLEISNLILKNNAHEEFVEECNNASEAMRLGEFATNNLKETLQALQQLATNNDLISLTDLDKILINFELLPTNDQKDVLEILKRENSKRRRNSMIANAKETSAAYRRGELKTQSLAEFLQEINTETSDGLLEARE